jgi:hypothetical protein
MHHQSIRYVTRKEINDQKWNGCIDAASNSLIYAYTFFLDNMAKNWDALILGDYETVMPLTWNKKWGIKYLYQPPFIQQHGIFSNRVITQNIIELFISNVKSHFGFAQITFNYNNKHQDFTPRPNYILLLNKPYKEIYSHYKPDLKNNLKRAEKSPLQYKKSDDLLPALELFQSIYRKQMRLSSGDFDRFKNLCLFAQENRMLIVREIYNERRLIASVVLLHKNGRIYLMQDAAIPEARKLAANHFLMNSLIEEFAGSGNILDFEGSMIPGVAHFYKNFGSTCQPYYYYYYNNLPWLIRLYKRHKYSR